MKKKRLKKQERKDFIFENVQRIFSQIRYGMEEGKCLFLDGLLNLSVEDLELLSKDTEETTIALFLIIHNIKFFDTDFTQEEIGQMFRFFSALCSCALFQKKGYFEYKYGINHVNLEDSIWLKRIEDAFLTDDI